MGGALVMTASMMRNPQRPQNLYVPNNEDPFNLVDKQTGRTDLMDEDINDGESSEGDFKRLDTFDPTGGV